MNQGQIIKIHSDFYYVLSDDVLIECKLREVIKKQQKKICVGDFVEFDNGYITKLLPRKNHIQRPSVSNIDQIVIVSAIEEPLLDFNQLDRYIAFGEYANIDIKLCFNKYDLKKNNKIIEQIKKTYKPMSYEIVFTSALNEVSVRTGINDFKKLMQNKTSVLCGASGVGKSSLLNAINPNFHLKTKSISEKTGRGTHTTRHCEILEVSDNTRIIDTPGFSNLKFDFLLPWEVGKLFKDFVPYIGGCKFQNCLHLNEVGCIVKDNIDNIQHTRYKSYNQFVEEAKEYKEKIKYEGIKRETFAKENNAKTTVKISAQKRMSSRKRQKQEIYLEEMEEDSNE